MREEEKMSHPVVWFEVMGRNGADLQKFYTKLFDWKIDASNPMNYGMVEATEGRGIPGGVGQLGDQPWRGKVWTLAAWCELREDFRNFRLDRVERIEAGEPFEEETGRTLRDYLRNIGPYAERLLDG
jgi:hypothetical protein